MQYPSIQRRQTRQVTVGDVAIGGGAPVSVQSMTNTPTRDVDATVAQIERLAAAGADIVRVAVPTEADTAALGAILASVSVPIVADVHFHFERALEAIAAGAHKIRLNPGNIDDRDKVRRAEHLDGKFVLTTNDDTLSVADIALGYKGMWIIESCFRKMKTTGLAVRPMFHWMPHRITAHVKLCVLALMIQRTAEIATSMTWRQIHDMLEPVKAVRYRSENRTIVQTSKIQPDTRDILKTLTISTPKTILTVA